MGDREALDRELDALMASYQHGDLDAFADLYSIMQRPLRRYLFGFVRDAATADDLLQEAFLQVHRARHTYLPGRPVRPWLYAIGRHVALMHLRASRRRREAPSDHAPPELSIPPELERIADRREVERLLSKLPRAAREVLILHHLLGLSFDQVGHVVGTSAGTAKVRAHRAISRIRQQLGLGEGGKP